MAKRKPKPFDPAALARAQMERLDREAEINRLRAQGVVVKLDPTRRIMSAYRSNVFNLLRDRGTINANQHDAAYRLSQDWAAWKGVDGRPDQGEKVDGGSSCRDLINDRMIKAGQDVADALENLPKGERRLLESFMGETVERDRPMAWRGIVERVLGVTSRERQTDVVVAALEHLREHYETAKPQHRVAARG